MEANRVFPRTVLTRNLIVLRELRPLDAQFIAIAGGDAETQKWLPLPNPYSLDDAHRFIDEFSVSTHGSGTGIVFAIEENQVFVGCIDVKRADWLNGNCEIGYWTMPAQRGRGIMSEALKLLAHWVLIEQGFTRVEVRIASQNFASQRVAEKAGFIREGIARKAGRVHAGRVDLIIYSIVSGDL